MRRTLIVKPLRNTQAINGMTPGKMFSDQTAFVGLQRADKVPLQIALCRQRHYFLYPFLYVVFAKRTLPGGNRFCDSARRFGFADRKQRDLFWRPAATHGSGSDTVAYLM